MGGKGRNVVWNRKKRRRGKELKKSYVEEKEREEMRGREGNIV